MASNFLQDDDGNKSFGRLMAAIALGVAVFVSVAPTILKVFGIGTCEVDKQLVLYFLGASFGGKVLQKHAERKK